MPLSPALAIIVSAYLEALLRSKQPLSITLRLMYCLPIVIAFIGSLVAIWLLPKLIGQEMSCYAVPICASVLTFLPLWFFWRAQFNQSLFSFAMSSILICAIAIPLAFVWFYQSRQIGIDKLTAIAKAQNASVATLFSGVPSVVFTMQKPVPEIKSLAQLEQFCHVGKKPHLLLATGNCLNLPELQAKQHIISTTGRWYLLNVDGYPW
jgi:hypothetical protein